MEQLSGQAACAYQDEKFMVTLTPFSITQLAGEDSQIRAAVFFKRISFFIIVYGIIKYHLSINVFG
jgi:hypothetical protein